MVEAEVEVVDTLTCGGGGVLVGGAGRGGVRLGWGWGVWGEVGIPHARSSTITTATSYYFLPHPHYAPTFPAKRGPEPGPSLGKE